MSVALEIRRQRQRRQQRQKRGGGVPWWIIALLVMFAMGSIGAAAGIGTVYAIYQSYAEDYVPIDEKLRQTTRGLTEVYDRGGPESGVLLGKLAAPPEAQLLDPVSLDRISKWMIEATVSTEDNSFYENPGVNIRGLARAAYENYVLNEFGSGTGGSSITQQLIKNVYICPSITDESNPCTTAERTLDRKLREIVYAIELRNDYEPDQVLTWYLNQISYAGQYIGVQAAAQGYFHKDAIDLTLGESALLAGIPQAPTLYHPRLSCVTDGAGNCLVDELGRTTVGGPAKARQEDVLDLMVVHGRATPEQVAAAKDEVLKVWPSVNEIKAAAWIDNQVEPRLVRMCEAGWLEQIPGTLNCEDSVHSAGYKVTTTIDWALTEQATAMMREYIATGLENGCDCHNAAIATIEPDTGQIIVYAANIDPRNTTDPRVNGFIDQLNEINQPGSSLKPAIYLAWMDMLNKHPWSVFWDTSPLPIEGTTVSITNPRGAPYTEGLITARAGLGGSQNVPAFRAALEVGTDNVIELTKKLGITTLQQGFDPTFRAHPEVTYGPSIATGGANVRAIDMAYMETVISNMGVMVGTPTLATYVEDPESTFKSIAYSEGNDRDVALKQSIDFARGHIRLPGTRELDPITVLQVQDKDGNVLWTQPEPERRQVVDGGSIWMLHSIMSDCTARFIIWGCGGSNNDLALDSFMADGQRIPTGIKTGTQQGPLDANDTLETWMTGYSRHAGLAVWVGNANNQLVVDGPPNYPSANATVRLFKHWMGAYHDVLQSRGVISSPESFDAVQPENVAQRYMPSPHSETRNNGKGDCDQTALAWVRTDVTYANPCEPREIDTRNGLLASSSTPAQFRATRFFPKLPEYKPDLALKLAQQLKLGLAPSQPSTGEAAVSIASPTNGQTVHGNVEIIGSVQLPQERPWRVEFGAGANPSNWRTAGNGSSNVSSATLGFIDFGDAPDGVYTVRLTAEGGFAVSTTFNYKKGEPTPGPGTPTVTPGPGTPTVTPGPGGGTATPQLPVPGTPTPTPTEGEQPPTSTPTPGITPQLPR